MAIVNAIVPVQEFGINQDMVRQANETQNRLSPFTNNVLLAWNNTAANAIGAGNAADYLPVPIRNLWNQTQQIVKATFLRTTEHIITSPEQRLFESQLGDAVQNSDIFYSGLNELLVTNDTDNNINRTRRRTNPKKRSRSQFRSDSSNGSRSSQSSSSSSSGDNRTFSTRRRVKRRAL